MTTASPLADYARIGLITGVHAEQQALLPDAPRRTMSLNNLSINQIDVALSPSGPTTIFACTPGIGKVHAAGAAAMLVTVHNVDLLAVIGTAGKIDPDLPSGAFLLPEAVQADYGAHRDGRFVHYRAGTLPIGEADNSPFVSAVGQRLRRSRPQLPTARIASGDSFVEDAARGQALRSATGAALVDMETAAVAQLADQYGIDWVAVKAVSDDADEHSATSFGDQLAIASRQAAELFELLLTG